MRSVASYSMGEWLMFKPFVHRFKYVRNQAVSRAYLALGTGARDMFLAENAGIAGGPVAVTIAFNTPWVIELFLRAGRMNLSGAAIIVLDNSSAVAARAEIAALCRRHGAAYVPLPRNPEWSPNRSHGIALNWAYYNVIRPLGPPVFAFLDHDLFALEPIDLAALVEAQPVYGLRQVSRTDPGPWSLWAGYCVFDQKALRSRMLDFNYESPLALDTGGYNWSRLYRDLDETGLRFATGARVVLRDPRGGPSQSATLMDAFVHVGSASHKEEGRAPDRVAFFRQLVTYLEAGGRWQDLVVSDCQ